MKKSSLLIALGSTFLLLPVTPGQAQKKTPALEKAAAAVGQAAPAIAATVAGNSFGLTERLPADTDMALSFHNIDKHTAALTGSLFWKKVTALAGGSLGGAQNPKSSDQALAMLQALFGREVTLSFAKGSAPQLKALKELINFVNVAQYEQLLGGDFGMTTTPGANPFGSLLKSKENQAEFSRLLQTVEVPSILIQSKVANAKELLAQLIPLDKMPAEAKQKLTVTTTPIGGATFTTIKVKLGDVIPPDADKQQPDMKPLLDALRKKTVDFTYGAIADDVAVFSIGKDHSHVVFAPDAAGSVLANPDFATVATPLIAKNLALSLFASKEFIEGTWDDQPLQPIVKGLFAALKKNKTFAPLAKQVEPEVAKLAAAEKALFKLNASTMASVIYWDKGLNIESRGGSDMRPLLADKPLSFDHLISGADVFYGVNAQGNPEFTNDVRNYFEAWISLLYKGAKAYAGSPLADKNIKDQWAGVELVFKPAILEIYEGSKTVYQKGLGNESAVVVDFKGKLPPAFAEMAKGAQVPRIAYLHDTANRAAIGQGWDQIVPGLEKFLVLAPPDEEGNAMKLPPVQTKKTGDFTSYFFALPLGSPDVLPTATVSDQYFALGSSQLFNEQLLGQAGKSTGKNYGAVGYFNVKVLRDALKPLADMQTASAAEAGDHEIDVKVEDEVDTTKPAVTLPKNSKDKKGAAGHDDAAVAEEKDEVPDVAPAVVAPSFNLNDLIDLLSVFEKGNVKIWKEDGVWRDSTRLEIHDLAK